MRRLGAGHIAAIVAQAALLGVLAVVLGVTVLALEVPVQERLPVAVIALVGLASIAVGLRRWLDGSGLLMSVANGLLLVAVVYLVMQSDLWVRGYGFLMTTPVMVACLIGIGAGLAPPRTRHTR